MQFLKVTFHSQLLQNPGSIPHVIQYTLEHLLHLILCNCHSPTSRLPFPLPTGNHYLLPLSLLLLYYIH